MIRFLSALLSQCRHGVGAGESDLNASFRRYGIAPGAHVDRFGYLYRLDGEKHGRIVDSLRHRENDASIKLGAILGYCGLIVAALLVQLSAEAGTPAAIPRMAWLLLLAELTIILLFAAAFTCLIGIVGDRERYSDESEAALDQYLVVVTEKSLIARGASALTALASLGAMIVFLTSIIG